MAQPFDCFCAAPTCRGTITGARDMPSGKLDGLWLNGHIRELKEEQQRLEKNGLSLVHKLTKQSKLSTKQFNTSKKPLLPSF